jgi:hypothetical protein
MMEDPNAQPPPQQPQQPGQFQQGLEKFGPLAAAAIMGYLRTIGSPKYQGWGNALTQGATGALGTYQQTEAMAQQAQAQRRHEAALAGMKPEDKRWMDAGVTPDTMYTTEGREKVAADKQAGVAARHEALKAQSEAFLQSEEGKKLAPFQRQIIESAMADPNAVDFTKVANAVSQAGIAPLRAQELGVNIKKGNAELAGTLPGRPAQEPSDVTVEAKAQKAGNDARKLAEAAYYKEHSGKADFLTPMSDIAAGAKQAGDAAYKDAYAGVKGMGKTKGGSLAMPAHGGGQGPQPGSVEEHNGQMYRFVGGDPGDPASWEPMGQ